MEFTRIKGAGIKEKKKRTDRQAGRQEDGMIRGSNCFKCRLEEIPMMSQKLSSPQQGTLSPHNGGRVFL